MSSTWGIQLHVSALYIGHCLVVLKLIKELYKMRVGCPGGNEISSYNSGWHGLRTMVVVHGVYNYMFRSCVLAIVRLYLNSSRNYTK